MLANQDLEDERKVAAATDIGDIFHRVIDKSRNKLYYIVQNTSVSSKFAKELGLGSLFLRAG